MISVFEKAEKEICIQCNKTWRKYGGKFEDCVGCPERIGSTGCSIKIWTECPTMQEELLTILDNL